MRILIVSASAGGGHVSAAAALERAFRERHPGIAVRNVDALDFTNRAFKKVYAQSYLLLANRVPALWGFLYAQSNEPRREKKRIVSVFDRINYRRFRELVDGFAPDHVLGTHFLPGELARDGGLEVPFSLVVTDYDVHALWVQPGAARYFVGSEEVRVRLAARGIEPRRIAVTGIPIDPVFARPAARPAARAALELRPDVFTVLAVSGGFGMKGIAGTVREIAALGGPLQLVAVCGRNAEALEEVRAFRPPRGVTVVPYGFTDRMNELMAAADVAVTKSGGLTVSECLARRLPMVIVAPIPGQEERNCDYLLEAGAAWKAVDYDALQWKLGRLRDEPRTRAAMEERCAALARPEAAFAIADAMARLA